jgi:uncharacterized repeat protein (TIGR01451 family)
MRFNSKHAVLVSFAFLGLVGTSWAQDSTPARPPALIRQALSTLSLDGETAQITQQTAGEEAVAPKQLPQVNNAGPARETTVSERLRAIRGRGVDTAIGQPFTVADPRVTGGAVKAVPKRSLSPKRKLTTTVEQPKPQRQPNTPGPTLAVHPVPKPAAAVNTQPMNGVKVRTDTIVSQKKPKSKKAGTLLRNRAPSLAFETYGPKTITIGREAAYQVKLVNTGDTDARNLVVSVQLPPWAEVLSNNASSGAPHSEKDLNQNTTVRWELEQLKGGAAESLALSIIPRDSRPFDLAVGWSYAPAQSMAQIEVQEPKLEMSINGPDEVEFGETEVYTIAISNPGTGDAENVVLGLIPMMAQQQISGTRNLGTIKAGDRKSVDIELTAHQAGRLRVKANAFADGGLRTEIDQEVVVRRANLDVVIVGPPRNFAATVATYKVRVENTGDAMAEDATALVSLPAGATFVSCTGGGTHDAQRGQVEWKVGSLRAGTSRELELRCELNSPGDNRVDIQCTAQRDLNVTKSLVTTVEALADLKLYVDDPPGAIAVGQQAEYDIRILNRGTKAAENIQVVGYFSDGIEPISIRNGGGEVGTGQVMLNTIPTVGPGQEVVFRVIARAHAAGNHVFRAELQCSLPETKLAAEEWTKYYTADGSVEVRQASLPGPQPLELQQ